MVLVSVLNSVLISNQPGKLKKVRSIDRAFFLLIVFCFDTKLVCRQVRVSKHRFSAVFIRKNAEFSLTIQRLEI